MPVRRSAYSLLGTAFYLLGAAMCLWLFLGNAYGVVQAQRALNWPTATGAVEFSEVATGCGRGSSHFPRVLYSYEVAGTKLNGSRLSFGNVGCGSWSSAASVARKYKVGQAVQVHWNPTQSSDSVLLAGEVLVDTWYAIAISFVMLIAALWLVHYYWRSAGAA